MAPDSLASFSQQISGWTHELLEHGRFPFRKVSIAPTVATPAGEVKPDLVLWINQPSCMAGGVIFMPLKEEKSLFAGYAAAASSLGLQYFTVWGSRSISIHFAHPPYDQNVRLEIEETASPYDFRNSLRILLEELKPLAVTGAIPPQELSSWHLVNLCLMAVTEAQASILESMRRHRDELSSLDPERLSREHSWHTLFKLLLLITFDLLPETVHAERLEKALAIATESLPATLKECCHLPPQHTLPEAASIAFHHLFRRLTQIGWRDNHLRMQDALAKLLESSAVAAGSLLPEPESKNPLLCNPEHLDFPDSCSLLSNPGRLPGLLLERELHQLDPPLFSCTSPFQLPLGQEPLFGGIYGTLAGTSFHTGENLEDLLVHIRTTWPNRRFQLPRQPAPWALEWLHLFGMCAPEAEINLDTPHDWPRNPDSRFLTKIIAESFPSGEVILHPEGLLLKLRKTVADEYLVFTLPEGRQRKVEVRWLASSPDTAFAMALNLPDEMWGLLQREELAYRDISLLSAKMHPGLIRFLDSVWGHVMTMSCGVKMPKTLNLENVMQLADKLPLPPFALLEQLSTDEYLQATPEQLENDIEEWLGTETPRITSHPPNYDSAARRIRQGERKRLLDNVFVDGVPVFPGHYLYDYYQPETKTYILTGPLTFQRRFFNQVELSDHAGADVIVDNDLTAHALLLLSHGARGSAELPVSEEILSDIMQRYLNDLAALKESLIEQCNQICETAEKARRLARKLWREKNLPPWEFLERNF